MNVAIPLMLTIGQAGPAAPAEPNAASAYCRYVESVAESESALLVAPDLVASADEYRVTSRDGAAGGDITLMDPRVRVTAGIQYSIGQLRQGLLLRDRASAECKRYASVSALYGFVESHSDGLSRGALAAKLAVLERALPRALAILSDAQTTMEKYQRTMEDVSTVELRVEGLRSAIRQTREQMAGLVADDRDANRGGTSLAELFDRHTEAEERVERLEASLRHAKAWDLTFGGGYERLYGVDEKVPLFGRATVTIDLGGLFQSGADSRAVEWRGAWSRRDTDGVDDRAFRTVQKLRALVEAQTAGLREATVFHGALEVQMKRLAGLDTDQARRFRDDLWFELVRVEADQEFLRVQVEEMSAILAGAPKG